MTIRDTILEKYVDRAMDEFDTNGLARMFLRRLSHEASGQFLTAAIRHLRSNRDSNAHRFLATLALRKQEITGYLANPATATPEIARKLFKRFLDVDPSFDVRLARCLPDRSHANHAVALDGTRSIRALDILDQHSRGRRLLPILGHLPAATDLRVAAKATLFVGRRVQSPAWASKLLATPDQRIRANAIESIWGLNLPLAVELLERCTSDRNNRVLGNALVGLQIVGHRNIDAELLSLTRNTSAERRSTAAWAMGKLPDQRWAFELARMIRDEHPMVRSMALRSLIAMRRTDGAGPHNIPLAQAYLSGDPAGVQSAAVEAASEVVRHPFPELRLDGSSFRMRR